MVGCLICMKVYLNTRTEWKISMLMDYGEDEVAFDGGGCWVDLPCGVPHEARLARAEG